VNKRVNVPRTRIRKLRAMLHAWRKFGIERAGEEHIYKYRSKDGSNRGGAPATSFRNIVYGHLSYLKMVRGADDPLFLKLCSQVLELDPNPSKFLRQMVFGADDYEVFISHASEDKADIARPIYEACERAGIKAFLDQEHIGWGQSFASRINIAMGAARTVLIVVSSHSVSKEWPLAEINTALTFEVNGDKRVITVMVGNPDLTKLPLLRTKRWVTWEGDANKVVAELKSELRPAPPEPPPIPVPGQRSLRHDRSTQHRQSTAVPSTRSPGNPKRKRGFWVRLFGGPTR
ncbi:MAG: toll/interleukin-1 receptor domain-containing protein, partial [Pseudomonadota bacterium]